MPKSLAKQFGACKAAILAAITDALRERAEYVASFERTARGDIPVTGIALELTPWHGGLGLSLRLSSDYPLGNVQYDSADWPHFDFTTGCTSPSIAAAILLVKQVYEEGKKPDNDRRDFAHLTFLAGAEALLDPAVASILKDFDIDAPVLEDRFVSSPFQYIVADPDATLKSNYCDIVLANRVAKRVLENGP